MIARARVFATFLLLAGAVSCAKQPPAVAPEPPGPLEVPVTPPRVLAPLPPPEAPAPAPEPRVVEPKTPPRPKTPAPRTNANTGEPKTEPGKTEPPTAETLPPSAGPGEPPKESSPPALRTPQTANDAEADRRVREVLARATRGLDGIKRDGLSADARAQFDTARRFIDQATGALKARNYMFAAYLADKAETLVNGLMGR